MNQPDQAKFVDGMRTAIKEVLAEREEASRLDKVEEMLSTADATINELNNALAEKDAKIEAASEEGDSLRVQLEELKAKAKELEERLSETELRAQEQEVRATAAEGVLANMEADRKVAARMTELAEAKVVKTGDKLEMQAAKVRAMSDEEFASYKDDLVDARAELEAAIKAELLQESATAEETAADEVDAVSVPAADLDATRREDAAAAAAATLDIELVSSSLLKTYMNMGEAMAKSLLPSNK